MCIYTYKNALFFLPLQILNKSFEKIAFKTIETHFQIIRKGKIDKRFLKKQLFAIRKDLSVVQVYGNGKVAVEDLNLNFYEGQAGERMIEFIPKIN